MSTEMPPSYPPGSRPAGHNADHGDTPDDDDSSPAAHAGGRRQRSRSWRWARETIIVVVCALALSMFIKTFVAQAFYIPSSSMENTLRVGDRVVVEKFTDHFGDYERGDVVVFRDPGGWLPDLPEDTRPEWVQALVGVGVFIGIVPDESDQHLIKRVIGVGGDRVVCCTDDGQLTINGEPIDESYVPEGMEASDHEFDVVVPDGYYFVMGDNRANSADSRAHLGEPGGGMVPDSHMVGDAFVIMWPLSEVGWVSTPDEFDAVPDPVG